MWYTACSRTTYGSIVVFTRQKGVLSLLSWNASFLSTGPFRLLHSVCRFIIFNLRRSKRGRLLMSGIYMPEISSFHGILYAKKEGPRKKESFELKWTEINKNSRSPDINAPPVLDRSLAPNCHAVKTIYYVYYVITLSTQAVLVENNLNAGQQDVSEIFLCRPPVSYDSCCIFLCTFLLTCVSHMSHARLYRFAIPEYTVHRQKYTSCIRS